MYTSNTRVNIIHVHCTYTYFAVSQKNDVRNPLHYDRVLCDVPCRYNIHVHVHDMW